MFEEYVPENPEAEGQQKDGNRIVRTLSAASAGKSDSTVHNPAAGQSQGFYAEQFTFEG